MKKAILPIAILFLFATEILRIYFIMPFPGSQYDNTISIAYFIDRNIWWIRLLFLIVIFWQMIALFNKRKFWRLGFSILFFLLYGVIYYFLNNKLNADKMFYQPDQKIFTDAQNSQVSPGKLIVGVEINGEAKAYPIEIIGYHHQVLDTIGGKSVMLTYCTVCRTGRVYEPAVNGKPETFRLVGMDHFNALFEDETTKSWWRQATGEAITGKLKGYSLTEIISEQMTIQNWLRKYPDSKIMQPDPNFLKAYKGLVGFDDGTIPSDLEYRDFASWQFKSWVVGIELNGEAKTYDWNDLIEQRVINDAITDQAFVIVLENDTASFHVWSRDESTIFEIDSTGNYLIDAEHNSVWDMNGKCIDGVYIGNRLNPIKASQEFLHAWESFHPGSVRYQVSGIGYQD